MKKEPFNLNDIIDGCKKGDNLAFSALVDRYSGRFYGFFYSQTFDRQQSDDLLGEFYLKIVKSIKTYTGGSFEAWMHTIAKNVLYDYLRKHIRQRDNNIRYCEEMTYLDTTAIDKQDDFGDLQNAISQLDADSQELISMRFFLDMSFKEIAEATNRPIGTVLAKIHRGISKLKNILDVEK